MRDPNIVLAALRRADKRVMELREELNKSEENYVYCRKCDKYRLREKLIEETYTRKQTECVYRDAGYGDDDEIATVTRQFYVKKCPRCKSELLSDSYKIKEENRHTRR